MKRNSMIDTAALYHTAIHVSDWTHPDDAQLEFVPCEVNHA
jgi:hypothetical protein